MASPDKFDDLFGTDTVNQGTTTSGDKFDDLFAPLLKKKETAGSGDVTLEPFERSFASKSVLSGEVSDLNVPVKKQDVNQKISESVNQPELINIDPIIPSPKVKEVPVYKPKITGIPIEEDVKKKEVSDKTKKNVAYNASLKGDYEFSNQVLNTIQDDKDGYVYELMAYNKLMQGDINGAKEDIQTAINVHPNNIRLYSELMDIAIRQKDSKTANEAAEKYLYETGGVAGGDEEIADNLARVYALKGNKEESDFWKVNAEQIRKAKAQEGYVNTLKTLPDYLMNNTILGRIAFGGGRSIEAGIESIESAIKGEMEYLDEVSPNVLEKKKRELSSWDRLVKGIAGIWEIGLGAGMYTPAMVLTKAEGAGVAGAIRGALAPTSKTAKIFSAPVSFLFPAMAEFNAALVVGEKILPEDLYRWITQPLTSILQEKGVNPEKLSIAAQEGIKIGDMFGLILASKAAHVLAKQVPLPDQFKGQGADAYSEMMRKIYDRIKNNEPLSNQEAQAAYNEVQNLTHADLDAALKLTDIYTESKQTERKLEEYQSSVDEPTYRINNELVKSPEELGKKIEELRSQGVLDIGIEIDIRNDEKAAKEIYYKYFKPEEIKEPPKKEGEEYAKEIGDETKTTSDQDRLKREEEERLRLRDLEKDRIESEEREKIKEAPIYPKQEGRFKDVPIEEINIEEWPEWVKDNSRDPDEIFNAYQQELQNIPYYQLKPWQQQVVDGGISVTEASFVAMKGRAEVHGNLAKKFFRKSGKSLDVVAQDQLIRNEGEIIEPEELADFMIDVANNPSKYRKTTNLQREIAAKYKEVTKRSIKNHEKFKSEIDAQKLRKEQEELLSDDNFIQNIPENLKREIDILGLSLENFEKEKASIIRAGFPGFTEAEFEMMHKYLEYEQNRREQEILEEETPGMGTDTSKGEGVGSETRRPGSLETAARERIDRIEQQIADEKARKQNHLDRLNKSAELPLDVPKEGEMVGNAEYADKAIAKVMQQYDDRISALEREKTNAEKQLEDAIQADIEQGNLFDVQYEYQGGQRSNISSLMEPSGKPIKASDIITNVSKMLGIPIRIGKIRNAIYAGIYKILPEVVRLKIANDLSVMCHEMAHHIDKKTGLSNSNLSPDIKKELLSLDYNPKLKRISEGFAEFVRYYIISDNDAINLAPKFYVYFTNEFLPEHNEFKKVIDYTKDQVTKFRYQGARNRIYSMIDWSGKGAKSPYTFKEKIDIAKAKIISKSTDRLYPIKYIINQILKQAKHSPLRPSKDPYQLAMATAKTAPSLAREAVLHRTFDAGLQTTGKSLKDVLKPVTSKWKDAIIYAVAKRVINLYDRGINPGISLEDAKYIVETMKLPEFETFATELTEWSGRIMDYLIDAGGLSEKTAALIRQANPIYIALKRVIDNYGGISGQKKGIIDQNLPIKRIRGSGRDIQEPLKAMVKQTELIFSVADKARVANALADLTELFPGIGKWIEKVPPPVRANIIKIKQIANELKKAGADIDNVEMDNLLTIFSQGESYYGKDNIISIYRNGKPSFYQLHPLLYDAMKGMGKLSLPWFLNYTFGTATRFIRLGATGLNPGFGLISNPIRDIVTAFLQHESKGGGRIDKIARGILNETTGKGKYIRKFKASGVEMAQPLGMDRKMLNGIIEQALADNVIKKTYFIGKHPIEGLRKLFSITEGGVRYAEFESIMKKYEPLIEKAKNQGNFEELSKLQLDARIEATNKANEVTVNFKRAGHYSEIMNQIIPFFNPAVQGISRMGRTIWEHPTRSGLRAIAAITAPSLALWWLNKDEEWYQNLPNWQKYAYWNFKIGDEIIRIQRPFEWGYIFGALPEAAADWLYTKDPTQFKAASYEAITKITPSLMPGLLKPATEVYFNWDMFRERPIVSESMEGLMPEQQFYPYTSKFAKEAGKILNVSPLSIDHLLSGYTGGLALDILNSLPKEYKEKADWPVIGRLFTRQTAIGFNSQPVQDFYNTYSRLNSIDKTLENAVKKSNLLKNIKQEDIYNAINELNTYSQSLTNLNPDSIPSIIIPQSIKEFIPKKITEQDLRLYVIKPIIGQTAKSLTELRKMQYEIEKMNYDKDIKKMLIQSLNKAAASLSQSTNEMIKKIENQKK